MSGLAFKASTAQVGQINTQPTNTATSVANSLQAVTLSTTGPTVGTLAPIDLLKVHQSSTLPIFQSFFQSIIPTYHKQPTAGLATLASLHALISKPNPRFTAYEQLTGVSQVRPEMLLATNFRPIYDENHRTSQAAPDKRGGNAISGLNEVGEFMDAQVQLNNLRHEAMTKLLQDMKNADPSVSKQVDFQTQDFQTFIQNLVTHSNYLLSVVNQLESLRDVFDLRTEQFTIDFDQIVFDFFRNADLQLQADIDLRTEQQVSFVSLLTQLGFAKENVSKFTNTKIYVQTLYELKNLFQGYSNNLLGVSPIEQQADTNPTYVLNHTLKDFHFDAANVDTPELTFLQDLQQADVVATANLINTAYKSLFQNVHLPTDENKLAFLFQFLAKEYNLSSAIGDPQFRNFIQNTYGYSFNANGANTGMFDSIVGFIGQKITDVQTSSPSALTSVAQKIVNSVAVLPFETAYIQYENSVYTPGSVYLIDSMLNLTTATSYNTTNLQNFINDVSQQTQRVTQLIGHLTLVPRLLSNQTSALSYKRLDKVIGFAPSLFDSVAYSFLDRNTKQFQPGLAGTALVATFNAAKNDSYLKSLLFLYVYTRTFASSRRGSVQVLETIINQINDRVNGSLIQDIRSIESIYSRTSSAVHEAVPSNSITTELQHPSAFLTAFFNLFQSIVSTFSTNNAAIQGHFSRFSYIPDTTIMMIVFEALVSVIQKYVDKTFVGVFTTASTSTIGRKFLSTRLSLSDNSLSLNSVTQKLNFENDMMLKLLFVLLSAFQQVQNSSQNVIKFLSSDNSTSQLKDVLAIVKDSSLLTMLMNRQQVYLIKSILDDIVSKFHDDKSYSFNSRDPDIALQSDLAGHDEDGLMLLDDSLVTTNGRAALFSFLSQDSFTSKRALNTRLLTVGVPLGFSKNLQQEVKIDNVDPKAFNQKQADIIRINVYKIDVEHQDLIFKPRTFLFELNRYVSRNERTVKQTALQASLTDILDAFTTRDYSVVGNRLTTRLGAFYDSSALVSTDYSFLTDAQRQEIATNHVTSYLWEIYLRLLTGMQLSEYDFMVKAPDMPIVTVPFKLTNSMLDFRLTKLFPSKVSNSLSLPDLSQFAIASSTVVGGVQTPVTTIQPFFVQAIAHDFKLISDFGIHHSQFSDTGIEAQRIFFPKVFERIFTVAVNSDDFEIDVTETMSRPSGQQIFETLQQQGKIVSQNVGLYYYPSVSTPPTTYKLVTRDINEGDVTFEKYFFTIDTVLATEV